MHDNRGLPIPFKSFQVYQEHPECHRYRFSVVIFLVKANHIPLQHARGALYGTPFMKKLKVSSCMAAGTSSPFSSPMQPQQP